MRDAIVNARANNLKNIRFYKADAGEFMREAADEDEKPDVVFMDPPRAGSDRNSRLTNQNVSEKGCLCFLQPRNIGKRFSLPNPKQPLQSPKIQPVDMFPTPAHIETVVLMSRK